MSSQDTWEGMNAKGKQEPVPCETPTAAALEAVSKLVVHVTFNKRQSSPRTDKFDHFWSAPPLLNINDPLSFQLAARTQHSLQGKDNRGRISSISSRISILVALSSECTKFIIPTATCSQRLQSPHTQSTPILISSPGFCYLTALNPLAPPAHSSTSNSQG